MPLLSIKDLSVSFNVGDNTVDVTNNINLTLDAGKILGIVGESGCGKSVTALSIMRLLPQPSGQIVNGQILFHDQDLVKLSTEELATIRGNRIAMIFQDPMTALNPVHTIGKQLIEVYQLHFPELNKQQYKIRAIELLKKVGISDPEERFSVYPHQLSGGMRQRVMIAMALACEPDILIADEPTTALDVTIQAQILDLMQQLQAEKGMAIIFITHDLGVIAELCDDVAVMYAGRVVEQAKLNDLFAKPLHPYTQGLLSSIPRLDGTPKSLLHSIPGQIPNHTDMPNGCRFNNRCLHSTEQCKTQKPILESSSDNTNNKSHQVACFNWQGISP